MPWGTHNRIVQLTNCYIELLEVAEPEKIPPHGAARFRSAPSIAIFWLRGRGLRCCCSTAATRSTDARAFEAAGIGGFEVFDFGREGTKPDGTPVKLAFSLAFARDPASPNVRFAVCQHHFPENFWDPAFQTHANGAQARARRGDGRGKSDRPSYFPESIHRRQRSACEFDRVSPRHRKWRCRDHGAGVVSRSVRRFATNTSGEGMTLNALRFEVADLAPVEPCTGNNGIASRAMSDG